MLNNKNLQLSFNFQAFWISSTDVGPRFPLDAFSGFASSPLVPPTFVPPSASGVGAGCSAGSLLDVDGAAGGVSFGSTWGVSFFCRVFFCWGCPSEVPLARLGLFPEDVASNWAFSPGMVDPSPSRAAFFTYNMAIIIERYGTRRFPS